MKMIIPIKLTEDGVLIIDFEHYPGVEQVIIERGNTDKLVYSLTGKIKNCDREVDPDNNIKIAIAKMGDKISQMLEDSDEYVHCTVKE